MCIAVYTALHAMSYTTVYTALHAMLHMSEDQMLDGGV